MKITMMVKGRDEFTVDTNTGIISGKTYSAREFIKENFDAKWNGDTKVWIASVEKIEKEMTYEQYYAKYIVSKEEDVIEVEEENTGIEEVETTEAAANKDNEIIELIAKVKAKADARAKAKATKEVANEKLVNGDDGFYWVTYYKDGTRSSFFCG